MSKYKKYHKYAATVMASVAASMIVAPFVTTADTTVSFIDVNDKTVSTKSTQEAIYHLVELGAINGYKDGTFKPNKPISRAQTAKIFTGAFGLSLPEPEVLSRVLKRYSDVTPNHEYAVFIGATTVADVFQGKADGRFDPWSNITREQMAIVLGRILKKYNTVEDVEVNLDNIGDDAKEGVQIIANLGVTTELENFRPEQLVTRAQFAAFAFRTLTVIDESRN